MAAEAEPRLDWQGGWALYRRFWPHLRRERTTATGIGLLYLLTVPPAVVSPLVVRLIFDRFVGAGDLGALVLSGAVLVALTLFSVGVKYEVGLMEIALRNRVRFRVTSRLFAHLLRLPLRALHRRESGELMSRVRDDVRLLGLLTPDNLAEAGVEAVKAVASFTLLLLIDPGLALSGLMLVAVFFLGFLLVARPLRRRSEVAREADAASSAALHEVLAGLPTLRLSVRERRERGRFAGAMKKAVRTAAGRDVLGVVTETSFGLVFSLGLYVILAVGAWRILMGYSSHGTLFAFFLYLTQFTTAASRIATMIPDLQKGLASLQRIFGLLDEAPEDDAAGGPAPGELRGALAFRGVGFEYEPGRPALRSVDLEVAPGEVVALVGRSGAGKSTLVQLLPRLYDPTAGEILLDGRPLAAYPLAWLRQRIGVVPQDVFLFNRSIRENVAYATPQTDPARLETAAREANALEFIQRLPRGWETTVGERGVRLSGGEKQRLAIAREFLRDPPVLILDEATSQLDAESEALVREAFERLMRGRTCIVIAHRLSTVRNADRIVVLDAGRIVEIGTHAELLDRDGLYASLHRHQLLEGRPPADEAAAPLA